MEVLSDLIEMVPFLFPVLAIICIFFYAYTYYQKTTIQGGVIWGYQIPMSAKQKAWTLRNNIIHPLGIVGFFVCFFLSISSAIDALFGGGILWIVLWIVAVVAVIFVGTKLGQINAAKLALSDMDTSVLQTLPLIQAVEAQLGNAQVFVITFEGIGMADRHNYCYATAMYEEYRLGSLTSPAEVAILGAYFAQRYGDSFSWEPCFETKIKPGETFTLSGPGGVYVGHTQSTTTTRLDCYLFTRKQ